MVQYRQAFGRPAGTALAVAALLGGTHAAQADMAAAEDFLANEIGDLTTLSDEEARAEMQWFVDAAEPFEGMDIKVVSETITTHEYESKTLAAAFTAITGINVTHDLIGEGDVVEKLQTQMQSGENIYDAYINDSDLIGTHWRYQQARNLTDWMAGEGRRRHLPDARSRGLHRARLHHRPRRQGLPAPPTSSSPTSTGSATTGSRTSGTWPTSRRSTATSSACRSTGPPYEDIAEFFTGREIDGESVYGHMDYGKKDPLPRLALHRRVAVDGRERRQGRAERAARRRVGHPASTRTASRSAAASRAAATPTDPRPSTRSRSTSTG